MLRDNKKQKVVGKPVLDFDAVSLYPSAMTRLYFLEGIPKVLTREMMNTKYLLDHLFLEDQTEPNESRNLSGFFVHIQITKVGNILNFPLIVCK
jgi:hypothetical protein